MNGPIQASCKGIESCMVLGNLQPGFRQQLLIKGMILLTKALTMHAHGYSHGTNSYYGEIISHKEAANANIKFEGTFRAQATQWTQGNKMADQSIVLRPLLHQHAGCEPF